MFASIRDCAGYGLGTIMTFERRSAAGLPADRSFGNCFVPAHRRGHRAMGLCAGASPSPLFRLLNQQKYPASQLYLLMTLGPMIALLPAAEKWGSGILTVGKSGLAGIVLIFGRVPLFYYLLHIPLIHVSALAVNYFRDGVSHSQWYTSAPYDWVPEGQRWALGLLYAVWLADIVLLYFVCRWYARYKTAHPEKKWLKYI